MPREVTKANLILTVDDRRITIRSTMTSWRFAAMFGTIGLLMWILFGLVPLILAGAKYGSKPIAIFCLIIPASLTLLGWKMGSITEGLVISGERGRHLNISNRAGKASIPLVAVQTFATRIVPYHRTTAPIVVAVAKDGREITLIPFHLVRNASMADEVAAELNAVLLSK